VSEGPFKDWVKSHSTAAVSTPDVHRVCRKAKGGRGYCGRTSAKTRAVDWDDVTCADCRAAGRADGLDVPEEIKQEVRA
jgi:hypothetical protein